MVCACIAGCGKKDDDAVCVSSPHFLSSLTYSDPSLLWSSERIRRQPCRLLPTSSVVTSPMFPRMSTTWSNISTIPIGITARRRLHFPPTRSTLRAKAKRSPNRAGTRHPTMGQSPIRSQQVLTRLRAGPRRTEEQHSQSHSYGVPEHMISRSEHHCLTFFGNALIRRPSDSPYPEVRAAVSNMDDPDMPANTFRV